MTDSNLLRLAYVAESTIGTTPGSPAMKNIRVTGESLDYSIDTIRSEEIRTDRLTPDLIQTSARVNGGFNFEWSYGAFDDFIEGAMFSTWLSTPERNNNGVADSVITQVTDSTDTFTVASGGASFVAGHLIRNSGFASAANNGLFRVSSSTATTIVVGGTPTLTDEAAPAAAARIKVVGFRGASGDITATASGLGSTALNFTTLGLYVGQWIKIGGSTAGEQFATAADNGWARITAIAATALTLDNLPTGWATDSGTSKTITVYVGDIIKVGTTKKSYSVEKVLLGQSVPAYLMYRGLMVNTVNLNFQAGNVLSGSFDFLGMSSTISGSGAGASYTDVASNDVMNSVSDMGRVAEGGSAVGTPNFITQMAVTINNSLREKTAIGTFGLVDVGAGDSNISGQITTYFGSDALLQKFINNTASSINMRVQKSNKANVFTFPRVKFSSSRVVAGSRNSDVLVELGFQALRDTATGNQFQIDRFEEFA